MIQNGYADHEERIKETGFLKKAKCTIYSTRDNTVLHSGEIYKKPIYSSGISTVSFTDGKTFYFPSRKYVIEIGVS